MEPRLQSKERVTLRGRVAQIRFRKDSFVIFSLENDRGERVPVKGDAPNLRPGEAVEVFGRWVEDARYGRQVSASSIRPDRPAGPVEPVSLERLRRYLATGDVKGVGPAMAERICAAFGEDTLRVLSEEPGRLVEVSGIGEARAAEIGASFRERLPDLPKRVLLRGAMGFGERTSENVMRHLDEQGVAPTDQASRLESNPYLTTEVKRIGFKTADAKARYLGVALDSPYRLRAGLLYVLDEAAEGEGHTYLPRGELLERARKLLETDGAVIADTALARALEALLAEGKLVECSIGEDRAVYLSDLAKREEAVAARIHRMLATDLPLASEGDLAEAAADVEAGLGITLAPLQRKVLAEAGRHKLLVVTGGPGTGKTTTTRALVALFRHFGLRSTLLSPTGKAAKRLAEATGHPAATLHRTLYSVERANLGVIAGEALIVDEVSMVDLPLMAWLMKRVALGARLVFVGDADQLPSVGPGAVLRDLIASGVVPVVCLTEVFRQATTSGIIRAAHRINRGDLPDQAPDFAIRWIKDYSKDPAVKQAAYEEVAQRVIELAVRSRAQVLTPMRKSSTGVEALNAELQSRLNPPAPGKPEVTVGHKVRRTFRLGDRVICLKNNYQKGVFNGNVGEICQIKGQAVTARFDDVEATYTGHELRELELAYAFSIHRSQGSEFDEVIVPVTYQHFVLLARNLVYTAVTRAKKRVTVIGSLGAFKKALKTKQAAIRYSGLAERLRLLAAGD